MGDAGDDDDDEVGVPRDVEGADWTAEGWINGRVSVARGCSMLLDALVAIGDDDRGGLVLVGECVVDVVVIGNADSNDSSVSSSSSCRLMTSLMGADPHAYVTLRVSANIPVNQ